MPTDQHPVTSHFALESLKMTWTKDFIDGHPSYTMNKILILAAKPKFEKYSK